MMNPNDFRDALTFSLSRLTFVILMTTMSWITVTLMSVHWDELYQLKQLIDFFLEHHHKVNYLFFVQYDQIPAKMNGIAINLSCILHCILTRYSKMMTSVNVKSA